MKKTVIGLIIMLFGIAGGPLNHIFAKPLPYLEGMPSAFNTGSATGYFIWQDDDGVHIRTSASGAGHEFSGTVTADGKIKDVLVNSKLKRVPSV